MHIYSICFIYLMSVIFIFIVLQCGCDVHVLSVALRIFNFFNAGVGHKSKETLFCMNGHDNIFVTEC